MKNKQTRNHWFVGMYCCPEPGFASHPNRITDAIYDNLANVGINAIYGHYELNNHPDLVFTELELAKKHGIAFYPEEPIFAEFTVPQGVQLPKGVVAYLDRDLAERSALKQAMITRLSSYLGRSDCPGVFFSDEAGMASFLGIHEAKEAIQKMFPNKEFHLNHFNYLNNDCGMLYGGYTPKNPVQPWDGELANIPENRYHRYDYYFDAFDRYVGNSQLSADLYPYANRLIWGDIPTIHRGLFDMNAYFANRKQKSSKPLSYFSYLQAGSFGPDCREMTYAEMLLQMNVPMMYGHEGVVFFPGVWPQEWASEYHPELAPYEHGAGGLLDIDGKPTKVAEDAKRALQEVKPMADLLLSCEFLGIAAYGQFVGGFSEKDIAALPWNEAIWRGELPPYCHYIPQGITLCGTSSQLLISSFRSGEAELHVLLNSSTQVSVQATLSLPVPSLLLWQGEEREISQGSVSVQLMPGQALLIRPRFESK